MTITFSYLPAETRLPCVGCKEPTLMRAGYDPVIPGIPKLQKALCEVCLEKGEAIARLIGRVLDS